MSQVNLTGYFGNTASTLPRVDWLLTKASEETPNPAVRGAVAELLKNEQTESREAMATALSMGPDDEPDKFVLQFYAGHAREGLANILANICALLPKSSEVLPDLQYIECTIRRLNDLARTVLGNGNGGGNGSGRHA
ncbi:MAG: hypothetical protein PHE68_01775 [Candidatus Peribacteraceae bacterium]|nr:hypothetical protein [Candidatus Peribacteraceae bacterium]